MKKLLLTGAFGFSNVQIKQIRDLGFDVLFIQEERQKLSVDVSDVELVVCNSLFLYNDISLFKNLKLIQLTSAGMDRVPLEYTSSNRIIVNNASGVYSTPMAEWVILKILEIYKKSRVFYENQKKHIWQKQRDIIELTNKKVLIIGYGNVGEAIAKRLKPFGVNINVSDLKRTNSKNIDNFLSTNEIGKSLSIFDIVILSLPLNKSTRNMVNYKFLELMRNDSILINVSRGKIINQYDLIRHLRNNKFLGVVLDVFENEPLEPHDELWDFNNVYISPHNSFVSDMTKVNLYKVIIKTLVKYTKNNSEV